MDFLQKDHIVTEVTLPVFYPKSKGTAIPLRRYDHGLVLNVDCRAVYHFSTGEELTCRSGDCIFLPKGSCYTAERYPESMTERRGIYAISFLTLDEEEYAPFVIRAKGQGELLTLFSRSVQVWRRRDVGFREECIANLYRIFRQLKKEVAHDTPGQRALERLAPALNYIKEYYTQESVSTARLAALCGVSEPYLRRLFQDALSVSPAVYMRRLRIAYAKDLLGSGEYSVTDAAMLSGFNDPAYFSREFKKEVGTVPAEYKRQHREG